MLKLIKTSIVVQSSDEGQQHVERVLSERFIDDLLLFLVEDRSCNIAHNLVKEVFIAAIAKNYDYFVPTLFAKTQFCKLLSSMEGKTNSL
jgi:hypothetical protein